MKTKLIVDISDEEITISLPDGREVCHWVNDEWIDDPNICPAIATAINMAHTVPDSLIKMMTHHIKNQEVIKNHMTLAQIKKAVDNGKTVYYKRKKDKIRKIGKEYYIIISNDDTRYPLTEDYDLSQIHILPDTK